VHPLRVLILALLLYLLYRLLTRGRKKKRFGTGPSGAERVQPRDLPSHDLLVQDPVCRIYIPKSQAVVIQVEDKSVYFCSEKCREHFLGQKGER